jgi:predicted dehydrogenase
VTSHLTRRGFLQGSAPFIVPAAIFGKNRPSNRITVGIIGVGRQTKTINIPQFLGMPDVQIVAVCDVDTWRLENARQQVDDGYKSKGCLTYKDYRELLGNKSIDAVMIATPDHWHVPMSIEAVKAGKDVSCEKPLTRSIAEGRELADTVRRNKRVFRTDSEWRSIKTYHSAAELVRNGRIGELKTIVSAVPKGDVGCPPQPEMPVPSDLDYDRWQGPAPRAPYTEFRVHKPRSYDRPGWMRVLYYCDGMITNWGTHLNDLAQWAANTDRTGPAEVEGRGTYPPSDSFWNVLLDFEVHYKYANGMRLIYKIDKPYLIFEGTDGRIRVDTNSLETSPGVADVKTGDWTSLPFRSDKRDFIDAVKSRGSTLEDAEVGHRTTSLCHLGHIAVQLGRKLEWDPKTERFTDEEANRLAAKPIHEPRRVA